MNPSPSPARFTSAHGRATIVKILLVVGAIGAVFEMLVEALSFAFPPLTDEQALGENLGSAAIMVLLFLVGVLELIVYLTTVVFFSMWLYRAHDNLRALNPWVRLNYTSGFAVGSFFIPFINFVVPYRAVKEVWQNSGPAGEVVVSQPPAWFPLWWLFWLLASIIGNISMRISFNDNVPQNTVMTVSIAASALFAVAAVFAYLVVDAIDKRQEEASARVLTDPFSGPPPPPSNLQMLDLATPAGGPNNP
jgi:hypothetical protein